MCYMIFVFAQDKWNFYCFINGSFDSVKECVLFDGNLLCQKIRIWSFDPDERISESWRDYLVNDSGYMLES